jgi:hypothetical protein
MRKTTVYSHEFNVCETHINRSKARLLNTTTNTEGNWPIGMYLCNRILYAINMYFLEYRSKINTDCIMILKIIYINNRRKGHGYLFTCKERSIATIHNVLEQILTDNHVCHPPSICNSKNFVNDTARTWKQLRICPRKQP